MAERDAVAIERETREKYSGSFYQPDAICLDEEAPGNDLFSRMLAAKMETVRAWLGDGPVLDLCCANGASLIGLASGERLCVGADFAVPALKHGDCERIRRAAPRLSFLAANARKLPFADNVFATVYCLASLYHIPQAGEAVAEIGRVLRPGGAAVLDFGNLHSLNTVVCNAYPEFAQPCHAKLSDIRCWVREAGLSVVQRRAFQIFPYWGEKPGWLRPLLRAGVKRAFERDINGRTLDERVSSLPLLNRLAFRHLWVCLKEPS